MTREEHTKIIQEMLGMVTADNQAKASELLTKLSNDYEETLTNYETASTNVQDLTAKNETLRDVNAKLFLKVGTNNSDTDKQQDNTNEPQQEESELTFEKLFNEKGELL